MVALFASLVTLGVVAWALLWAVPKLVNQIIDGRIEEMDAAYQSKISQIKELTDLTESVGDLAESMEKR